jgi:CBS domain containing-hemolysin-like protein
MSTDLLLGIIFLVLATIGVLVKKTYYFIPARELKKRAEARDPDALKLYRAVAYGDSLRVILWLYIALTAATSFVLLAKALSLIIGLLVVALLLYLVFSLFPSIKNGKASIVLAKMATPALAWTLNYLQPPLEKASSKVEHIYFGNQQTGIYDSSDLMELILKQQTQLDNRLTAEELEIIKRAISFRDKTVVDVLIPRKQIKTILASDTIGPILINELHKSGQSHVLVKESAKGQVIGSLAFKDLNLKSQGQVRDLMNDTVYYLNAGDSLSEALHAFFTTNQAMFVVLNSSEEYVGVVNIEAIIRELMGHIPGNNFEAYTKAEAVAARHIRSTNDEAGLTKPTKTDDKLLE